MDISPGPSTAVTADTTGCRTSRRQRHKPQEFWRNEKTNKEDDLQALQFHEPESRRQRVGTGPTSAAAHGKTSPVSPSICAEPRRLAESLAKFTPGSSRQAGNPWPATDAGTAGGGHSEFVLPVNTNRKAQQEELEEPDMPPRAYGGSPSRPRRAQKAQAAAPEQLLPARSPPRTTRKAAAALAAAFAVPAPVGGTKAGVTPRSGRPPKGKGVEHQPATDDMAPEPETIAPLPAGAPLAAAAADATAGPAAAATGALTAAQPVSAGRGTGTAAGEPGTRAPKRKPRVDPVLSSVIMVLDRAPDAATAAGGRTAGGRRAAAGGLRGPPAGRHDHKTAARSDLQQTSIAAGSAAAAAVGAERQRAARETRIRGNVPGDVPSAVPVAAGTMTAARALRSAALPAPPAALVPPRNGNHDAVPHAEGAKGAKGGVARATAAAARPSAAGRKGGAKGQALSGDGKAPVQPPAQALPFAGAPPQNADEDEASRPKKRVRRGAVQNQRPAAQSAGQEGFDLQAARKETSAEPACAGASAADQQAMQPTPAAAAAAGKGPPRPAVGTEDGATGNATAAAARGKKGGAKSAAAKKAGASGADVAAQPVPQPHGSQAPQQPAGAGASAAGQKAVRPAPTGAAAVGKGPQHAAVGTGDDAAEDPTATRGRKKGGEKVPRAKSAGTLEAGMAAQPVPQPHRSNAQREAPALAGSISQRRAAAAEHGGPQAGQPAQQQEHQEPAPQLVEDPLPPQEQQQPGTTALGGSQSLNSEGVGRGLRKRRRGTGPPSAADNAATDSQPVRSAQGVSASGKDGAATAPGSAPEIQTQPVGRGDAWKEDALVAASNGDGAPGAGPGCHGVALPSVEPAASEQQQPQPSAAARLGDTTHGGGSSAHADIAAMQTQQGANLAPALASNTAALSGDLGAAAAPPAPGGLDATASPVAAVSDERREGARASSGSGRGLAELPADAIPDAGRREGCAMAPRLGELSPSESVAQSNVPEVRAADAAGGAARALHPASWTARQAKPPPEPEEFRAMVNLAAGSWCSAELLGGLAATDATARERRGADCRNGGTSQGRQRGASAATEPEERNAAGAGGAGGPGGAADDRDQCAAAHPHQHSRRIPPPPPRFDDHSMHGADCATDGGGGFFAQRAQHHGALSQRFPVMHTGLHAPGRPADEQHAFAVAGAEAAAGRGAEPGAGLSEMTRSETLAARLSGQGGGGMACAAQPSAAAAGPASSSGEPGGGGFFVKRGQSFGSQLRSLANACMGHDSQERAEHASGDAFAAAGAGRGAALGAGPQETSRFEEPACRRSGQVGGSSLAYPPVAAAGAAAMDLQDDVGSLEHVPTPCAGARRSLWVTAGDGDHGAAAPGRLRQAEQQLRCVQAVPQQEAGPLSEGTRQQQRLPEAAAHQRCGEDGMEADRQGYGSAGPAAGLDGLQQGLFGVRRSRDADIEARLLADEGRGAAAAGGGGGGLGGQQRRPLVADPLRRMESPTYRQGHAYDDAGAAEDAGNAAVFGRSAVAPPGLCASGHPAGDTYPARRQQQQQHPGASQGDPWQHPDRRDVDWQQQRPPGAVLYDNDVYGGDQGLCEGAGGDGQGANNAERRQSQQMPPPPPPVGHQQPVWQAVATAAFSDLRSGPGRAEASPCGACRHDASDRVDAMDVDPYDSPGQQQPVGRVLRPSASPMPQPLQQQQQSGGVHEARQQQASRHQASEGLPGGLHAADAAPAGWRDSGQPPNDRQADPWGQRATHAELRAEVDVYAPAPQVQPQREPPPQPRPQPPPQQQQQQPLQPDAPDAPGQAGLHGWQAGAAWPDAATQAAAVGRPQQRHPTASQGAAPSQAASVNRPMEQKQQPPPPPRQQQQHFVVPTLRANRLQAQQAQQEPQQSAQQEQQRVSSADGPTIAYLGAERLPCAAARPAASAAASANPSAPSASEAIRRALSRADAVQKRNKTRHQEIVEREEDGWTLEQVQELQTAYYKTSPTHPHFWVEVARQVHGKTAAECFSRVYGSGRSRDERAFLAKVLRRHPASGGAAGANTGRPATVAAARKWSQKEHEREQLERLARLSGRQAVQDDDEAEEDDVEDGEEGEGPQPGAGGRKQAAGARRRRRPQAAFLEDPTAVHDLLNDLKLKQHADRFITSFLSKQGGWAKWHKSAKEASERRLRGGAPPPPRAGDARRPPLPPPAAATDPAARPRNDPLARLIQHMLAKEKAQRQRQEWREDDRAEGLLDEEAGGYDDQESEGEIEGDEEQEEEERELLRYLLEEGIVGPDGMPVLT